MMRAEFEGETPMGLRLFRRIRIAPGLTGTGLSYTEIQAPARRGPPKAHHYIVGFIALLSVCTVA